MGGTLYVMRIQDEKLVKNEDGIKIFGVRIPKFLPDGWIHLPNTAPPEKLLFEAKSLEKEGKWNEKTFRKLYLPEYLSFIKGKKSIDEFLDIKSHLDSNINVFYACYCPNEKICHRCIVKRIFELRGYDVKTFKKEL